MNDPLSKLQDIVDFALNNGASDADAYYAQSYSFSYGHRMGKPESIERSEETDLSVRLYKGQKKQTFNASNLNKSDLEDLIIKSVHALDDLPEDPYCGLATPDQTAQDVPNLSLADSVDPSEEQLKDLLAEAEETALSHDQITNSKGGHISWDRTHYTLVSSNGFAGSYEKTIGSYHVQPVAGTGDTMQVDHDFSTSLFFKDLRIGKELGHKAAEKTIAKLNPRKIKTGQYPVVFSKDVSNGLLNELWSAVSGSNIARGVSFLKEKKGSQLLPDTLQIIDDPMLDKGLGSKPFDREGFPLSKIHLIKDGVLNDWIMNLISSRKLNCEPLRGSAGKTNLYLTGGKLTHDELIADIKDGFYMTNVMSHPDTLTNGDYNIGCSGFWIENGVIGHPVHEVTLSGNLISMFENLSVANDLSFEQKTNAPTMRIEGMTVAGE
jgi:PmbA protein